MKKLLCAVVGAFALAAAVPASAAPLPLAPAVAHSGEATVQTVQYRRDYRHSYHRRHHHHRRYYRHHR